MKKSILLSVLCLMIRLVNGQPFTKITDSSNPIVSDGPQSFYEGASWIDYDNDGKLDLFVVRKGLYHNDGGGNFTKITGSGINTTAGLGNSWADYNNDGNLDCFISGGNTRGSSLYTNNGNGTFTRNLTGPLVDSLELRAWNCAWGDYDNDSYTDVVLVAPLGFISIDDNNKLLHNLGDGTFERVDTSIVCDAPAPYTIGSWSDYDDDGDMDLFIGSGPVNGTLAPDYLYKNHLTESGQPYFKEDIPAPLTSPRDGQQWNWIDFDNDGDLDGFVTNYVGTNASNGFENDFYRNDNGTFVKLTSAQVGPIVTDEHISVANVWEDFDNDGDMDCLVINDGGDPNDYYQNNWNTGSTVFTKVTTFPFINSDNANFSATAGDYDNDGDLDLFVTSAGSTKGLYRNDQQNGNSWVNIRLVGTSSNKAAIGARVRVKATINGNPVWLQREVSAQSSFNGMNSLNAEFGFGNATIIDSLKIRWPSGTIDHYSGIAINKYYTAVEGESLTTGINDPSTVKEFAEINVYPNPCSESCRIRVVASNAGPCSVALYDLTGNMILPIYDGILSKGENNFTVPVNTLSPGCYLCTWKSDHAVLNTKIMVVK